MQKFVAKYGLAAHLAMLAVAPLFLYPFADRPDAAKTLLWLSLFAAFWLFLEPSKRMGEMLHESRMRLASAVWRDPLFYAFLAVAAFAAVRWANGGVAVAYDPEKSVWFVAKPAIWWLPGRTDGTGFLEFASVVAVSVSVLGCRHALGKSARVAFLLSASVFSGIAAVAAVCASVAGHEGVLSLMLPPVAAPSIGHGFGLALVGSVVALAGGFECKWNKLLLLFSFAIGANAAGLFWFSPAPVTLVYAVAALVAFAGCVAYAGTYLRKVDVLRFFAAVLIASVVPVLLGVCAASPDATAAKLAPFSPWSVFPESFWSVRARLSEIAASSWKAHSWLGTGLGSFPVDFRFAAGEEDWALWAGSVPAQTLNGWWLVLCERGIFGAAVVALPLAILAVSFGMRLAASVGRHSFYPLCALGPVAIAAVVAATFFDASFMRHETFALAGSFAALSAASFAAPPSRKGDGGQTNGD